MVSTRTVSPAKGTQVVDDLGELLARRIELIEVEAIIRRVETLFIEGTYCIIDVALDDLE